MNTAASDNSLDAYARAAVTIGQPVDDLRVLWLDPETQARIWSHFADVIALDVRTADWVARGPAGGEYRWRTEVAETGSDEIRWSSLEGADVPNTGVLAFRPAPGDRGSELHLNVRFDPPGGVVGEAVSKLFHIVPRRDRAHGALQVPRARADRRDLHHRSATRRPPRRDRSLGAKPMRALCWNGVNDLRVETVDDPKILNPRT